MSRFQTTILILISVAVLWLAQAVLIPLVLAALLAMLLGGPVQRLERWRVPRVAAVTACVLVMAALIVGFGWLVGVQVVNLAENMKGYRTEIAAKVKRVRGSGTGTSTISNIKEAAEIITGPASKPAAQPAGGPSTRPAVATQPTTGPAVVSMLEAVAPAPLAAVGSRDTADRARDAVAAEPRATAKQAATTQPAGTDDAPWFVYALPPPETDLAMVGRWLGLALGPLGTAGVVVVFVFFILLEREDLRDRVIRLVSHGKYTVTTTAVDDGLTRVLKFMRAQAIVNGSYGIAVAVGLCAISLTLDRRHEVFPSFLIWGLLGAVLRFVPYVGPWIAAAFPLTLSLAAYPGFTVFAAVIGMYLLIELVSNNIMEPMLYGATTGLSTMAILVSAVFWTWLWGPVGLLLATPLTVVMMVVGRYAPPLHFLEVLLGDRPAMSPAERVYQRLLAGDEDEALDVATAQAAEHGLLHAFDEVLLPALSMEEHDCAQGLLDDDREHAVKDGMRRIVEELGQGAKATRAEDAAAAAVAAAATDGKSAPGAAAAARPAAPVPSGIKVAVLPAHDEADELAGLMLTYLLRLDGADAVNVSQNALAAEMVEAVTAFAPHAVLISATPPAAVSHVKYLMRRLAGTVPDERVAVGVWSAKADADTLRKRLNAAQVPLTTSFREALAAVRKVTESDRHTAAATGAAAPALATAGG